jgi:alpha-ketoglutarate-dependent taurine dioxygenase
MLPFDKKISEPDAQVSGAGGATLTHAVWISNPNSFIAELQKTLQQNGYAHLKDEFSLDEYERIAGHLGTVFLINEIQVLDTTRTKDVASNSGFGFHTDSFCANFVSWYCVTPGNDDEPTLLLDCADLTDHLSPSACRVLSEMQMPARAPDVATPILAVTDRVRLNFIPWRPIRIESQEQVAALKEFKDFISARSAQPGVVVAIKLGKGEVLIIDNHRILHGRPPLKEDTPRHFKRFWISEDPGEKERWVEALRRQAQVASSRSSHM